MLTRLWAREAVAKQVLLQNQGPSSFLRPTNECNGFWSISFSSNCAGPHSVAATRWGHLLAGEKLMAFSFSLTTYVLGKRVTTCNKNLGGPNIPPPGSNLMLASRALRRSEHLCLTRVSDVQGQPQGGRRYFR